MAEFESQVLKIGAESRRKVEETLHGLWENLLWEEEVELPNGKKVKGLVFRDNSSSFAYVDQFGGLHYQTRREDASTAALSDFFILAREAEECLFKTRQKQVEKIENTPEGKDVIWKSRQVLHGYTNFERSSLTVRMKKDGLYCSEHPQKHLIDIPTHDGQGGRALVCPIKECRFSGVDIGI
jgi:dTDP-4-dehydrorhamnose 3,5-epimerase-like enzyme